jgi:hypothetical protein
MTVFQVTGTDSAAVSETFNRVSAFVQSAQTKAAISEGIHLGDYIDLPSLSVTGYDGTANSTDADYGDINVTNADLGGTIGAKLRLIVVGINSFNSTDSTNNDYNVTDNDGTPHVVFQFQNLPGTQRMNTSHTSAGGYKASLMRKYLVPNDGGSGNFLTGLTNAGVPSDVLWGPKRSMAKEYNDAETDDCNIIEDLLWLPTVWEMFGSQSISPLSETAANQARLEYYADDAKRIKYGMSGMATIWWDASPSSFFADDFCATYNAGGDSTPAAGSAGGVAPAFCVR